MLNLGQVRIDEPESWQSADGYEGRIVGLKSGT